MKKISFLLVTGLVIAAVHSCRYDNIKPQLKVVGACDTTVSYATTILPLMNAQCTIGCHSGATPSASLDLTNYAQTAAKAASIKNRCFVLKDMPQIGSGYTLTDYQRQKISCWVDQGALNN